MSTQYTLIPVSNPLCQELQRGYNNYSDGAVISSKRHILDKTGEWLVGPIPDAPNPNEPYANVHPGDNHDALSGSLKFQHIYFIRFWTRDCKACGKPMSYEDGWHNDGNDCDRCHAA